MQNGVTLETNEKDLKVKYGMINLLREERLMARTSLKYILHDMNDIRTRYIRLGFHLDEFRRNNYFIDFGYPTMEEFCAANIGLDKSAISRCINVYREFNASNNIKYENGTKTVGSSMELDDKWKEYSYSQLCEMVSMDDMQRKQVTPDMTIKQIRELKRENVSQNVSPVATSQPFVYKLYENAPDKVRTNLIKDCDKKDTVCLDVFDKNGEFVYGNIWCELICTSEGHYMFRLL